MYRSLFTSKLSLFLLCGQIALPFVSSLHAAEFYEDKRVKEIEVVIDCRGEHLIDPSPILSRMKTQKGDLFSQQTFDNDLKTLSEEYDRVEPSLRLKDGQVYIEIRVTPRPLIHTIVWEGNKQFKTSTLQEELKIQPHTLFNRQSFNKAFNQLKEFYFKKGYFESQLSYSVVPLPDSNQVDIVIEIEEGQPGYIKEIRFNGLTKEEEEEIREQFYLKKYNFLTSWISGAGIYRDEMLEQDQMTLVTYLHNKGFADARVEIQKWEDPASKKLIIQIDVEKGQVYHFGDVAFEGNTLISNEDLEKRALFKEGSTFSPEKMQQTSQAIKELYGQKGYIDASVQFEANLREDEPIFDVHYTIEEGLQYKIGLIHIFGNSATNSNVILRESLLVPGETFDARKLKATQQRLEAVGYFKSVNVYAVRSPEDNDPNSNHRDVYIEVEETSTGNVSLFMGFSSTDDVFGGLDLTERNFNAAGILKAFGGHLSSLRGGGEYFHVRGTAGNKQNNILISWLNPYVNDSLWRLGVELSTTFSDLQDNVNVKTYGGSITASYPLSTFWTTGFRQRFRHSYDHLELHAYDGSETARKSFEEQQNLVNQNGLVSAVSWNVNYDSTNSPYKPRKGWRSYFETEMAGVGGKYQFFKTAYLNSLYFPVSKKGTLKFRAEFKYMIPFGKTDREHVPYSERFFLGGDSTVRGYQPFLLGPVIHLRDWTGRNHPTRTAKGGLSSSLLSLEYNYEVIRMLDLFTFVDVGSVSFDSFAANHIRPTTGVGARIDLGNRAPIMVGWGIPLVRKDRHNHKWQRVFFSMGGQF